MFQPVIVLDSEDFAETVAEMFTFVAFMKPE